jgi:hypothetical protein
MMYLTIEKEEVNKQEEGMRPTSQITGIDHG